MRVLPGWVEPGHSCLCACAVAYCGFCQLVADAMATACLIALFFVDGWLVPIDPSCFQSSTNVLILLLTIDCPDPFLSGMIFVLSAESIGRAFHQSWRGN